MTTDQLAEKMREALRLLAAEDDRQYELLETIREQIRLEVQPGHRPDGLFQNIQDAVYAMRGRTLLMNDAAITSALSASTKSDGEACGDYSQASQRHNADLQPSPSDPIPPAAQTEREKAGPAPIAGLEPVAGDPIEDLVQRFSEALLAKLRLAQSKGRSGWDQDDWEDACRTGLMRHINKGDPRDVAAYCAFMWHHGWSTAPPKSDPIAPLTEGSFVKGGHNSFPSQIKDRPAAPAPINKPPAQPAPIAGLEPVAWQPIKTAPRDGTPILCFTPDYQSEFSDQSGIDVLWFDEGAWLYNAEPVTFQPTHWMPLPASPNSASSGYYTLAQLEAHAAEQVRAERERIAAWHDEQARNFRLADTENDNIEAFAHEQSAAAIRARGQV